MAKAGHKGWCGFLTLTDVAFTGELICIGGLLHQLKWPGTKNGSLNICYTLVF